HRRQPLLRLRRPPIRIIPLSKYNILIMINNLNNFNSSSFNISPTERFSSKQNSPHLTDTSNTISFASLNVRGINDICKFDDIFDDLINENLSIIGLQETRLTESNAKFMFKNFIDSHRHIHRYKDYWSFNSRDSAGGVCLIVSPFVSKYIQKIHRHDSRFIAIDLFLPAKKLKVINIYNHQQGDFLRLGKPFANFVIRHIEEARKANFKIIIMGDFNTDASMYFDALIKGHTPPAYFGLTKFLIEHDFIEQHALDSDDLEFATHYVNNKPVSRIDQIWFLDDFLPSEHCFDRIWTLPCTTLSTHINMNLDHRCVITYFTKSLFIGDLPAHTIKQKRISRIMYDTSASTPAHWIRFQRQVVTTLPIKDPAANIPSDSQIPFARCVLNAKWSAFRQTITEAALEHIPYKRISPIANQQSETDESIIRLKIHINRLNRIYAFITSINYNFNVSIFTLQSKWTGKDNYRDELIQINSIYQNRININDIPIRIKNHNDPAIAKLRVFVAALRNSLRAIRIVKENNNKAERIKYYEDLCCINFAEHKAAFIALALNKSKRSIILDRAMCVDEFNNEKLLTDPTDVKQAAIEHFKTIAGTPPSINHNINTIPMHWQEIYRPMDEVDV